MAFRALTPDMRRAGVRRRKGSRPQVQPKAQAGTTQVGPAQAGSAQAGSAQAGAVPAGRALERPLGLVVMGVSGSGKTTLTQALAAACLCPVLEGDAFHSPANVAKMQAGHPLTDADRWPWLDRLGAALGAAAQRDGMAVAACSALKRSYRERLAAASAAPLCFVLLETDAGELARRMTTRSGHYMPTSLLGSQLATLEPPGADECAVTLDAAQQIDALVAQVDAWLCGRRTRPDASR